MGVTGSYDQAWIQVSVYWSLPSVPRERLSALARFWLRVDAMAAVML
jgi:hypothetical protein